MLITILSLSVAHADIAPPPGIKTVRYYAQVDGAPADGDSALVVYPWSLSNGAPTAEALAVPADGRVQFGRRVGGSPAFWAVPRQKLLELGAMDEAALRAWFEGTEPRRCTGDTPEPRHERLIVGSNEIIDTFLVKSVGAEGCEVVLTSKDGGGGQGSGCLGCRSTGAPALAWLGLTGLLAVVRRRR